MKIKLALIGLLGIIYVTLPAMAQSTIPVSELKLTQEKGKLVADGGDEFGHHHHHHHHHGHHHHFFSKKS